MERSYNLKKKIILIPGSVKKQFGSGSGLRFLAGSGFNEYGSETLEIFRKKAEKMFRLIYRFWPATSCTNPAIQPADPGSLPRPVFWLWTSARWCQWSCSTGCSSTWWRAAGSRGSSCWAIIFSCPPSIREISWPIFALLWRAKVGVLKYFKDFFEIVSNLIFNLVFSSLE